MSKAAFCGIDPGLAGGIAILYPDRTFVVYDLPTIVVTRPNKNRNVSKKRDYLIEDLHAIFQKHAHEVAHAGLEKVHAMPGNGAVSMFNFGRGVGLLEGLLVACGIRYDLIPPQRWQGVLLDGMPRDKSSSVLRAKQLFPSGDPHGNKRKDGHADALLIGEYVRRLYTGGEATA